jgi:hypothetical protein
MALRDWFFNNRSFHVKVVKDGPGGEEEVSPSDIAKNHFDRYKPLYITGGSAVVLAGFTCLMMRGRYEALAPGGAYGPETADTLVTMRPLSFFSKQENLVKIVNRSGHGRPGYLIHSLNTDEYFASQREAASIFGISETLLSKHLSGKLPDAEGYNFERLTFAG